MVLATMSSSAGSCSRRVHGLWPSHLLSSLERARAPCRALAVSSPKNLPSPRQSISGWELNSLINQEVPDFERPTRKNLGTVSPVELVSGVAPPAGAGRGDLPDPGSPLLGGREPGIVPLRESPTSRSRKAFMFRAISKAVRYLKSGTRRF